MKKKLIFLFLLLCVTWSHLFSPLADQGTVQKVVVLPTNFSASGELILEEMEVFQVWLSLSFVFPVCMFTQTLCSNRLWQGQPWFGKRSSKCACCQFGNHRRITKCWLLWRLELAEAFFFSYISVAYFLCWYTG